MHPAPAPRQPLLHPKGIVTMKRETPRVGSVVAFISDLDDKTLAGNFNGPRTGDELFAVKLGRRARALLRFVPLSSASARCLSVSSKTQEGDARRCAGAGVSGNRQGQRGGPFRPGGGACAQAETGRRCETRCATGWGHPHFSPASGPREALVIVSEQA